MAGVAGEDGEIGALRQGGDGHIRKTLVPSGCNRSIGDPPGEPAGRSVQRQNAFGVALDQAVEPRRKASRARVAARFYSRTSRSRVVSRTNAIREPRGMARR